jgi:hypothetical protein
MVNWSWNEYSTEWPNLASSPAPVPAGQVVPETVLGAGQVVPETVLGAGQVVPGVVLLGVRVTAYAVINVGEHWRREAAGLGAVTRPALLDRLLDLPAGAAVIDPVIWAETADQPPGILDRGDDGASMTRWLEPPVTIADVVVQAAPGRALRAVQEASLFAGFSRRWVAAGGHVADTTLLEAKLCGVGLVDPDRRVLLAASRPAGLVRDGWSWLLEEQVYRRWLSVRLGGRGTASPDPATGAART